MRVLKLIRGAAVVLATAGIVLPLPSATAGESTTKVDRSETAKATAHVFKNKDGQFVGRVVDHSGNPVEKTTVIVRQGAKEYARLKTDKEGMFAFQNIKPGTYQVGFGNTEAIFRVYNKKDAPPAAKPNALLCLGDNGERGQYASVEEYPSGGSMGLGGISPITWILGAGVIGSGAVAGVALSKANSVSNNNSSAPASP